MFQVRIHGRGGQGVVTAAEMLSVAAFEEGRHAQGKKKLCKGLVHGCLCLLFRSGRCCTQNHGLLADVDRRVDDVLTDVIEDLP